MNLALSLPELHEIGPRRTHCSGVFNPLYPVYLMVLLSPHFPYLSCHLLHPPCILQE